MGRESECDAAAIKVKQFKKRGGIYPVTCMTKNFKRDMELYFKDVAKKKLQRTYKELLCGLNIALAVGKCEGERTAKRARVCVNV